MGWDWFGRIPGLYRFLSSLLFGVTATDPLTFCWRIILLALVALAACYILHAAPCAWTRWLL